MKEVCGYEGYKRVTNVGRFLAQNNGPGILMDPVQFGEEVSRQQKNLSKRYGDCKQGPAFDIDGNEIEDMVGLWVPMEAWKRINKEE